MTDKIPGFLIRKPEGQPPMTQTTAPQKAPKKKHIPDLVRRITVSIPLDEKALSASLDAAEKAVAGIAATLPAGSQVEIASGNPLGKMVG